jgi:predicted phosphodiesterase
MILAEDGKENIISIMHISDLHKSPQDCYDNLYQSLIDDYNDYINNKKIQKPTIIVVSGDIIKGGNPDEISVQYKEVKLFLEKLTDFFLSGDKNHIIIVPGNHDIDWNISRKSMTKIPNNKENIIKLKNGNQKIRWSWDDFSFYMISDEYLYNKRLERFVSFYNEFYNGLQAYSLNPNEQYQIFDLPEDNITFFAYNSCFNNDHLNFAGSINPVCFSYSSQYLDRYNNLGRFIIGVWHHNLTGLLYENNYMDKQILKPMTDRHIKIGLFGHQHSCDVINEYKNIFDKKKILLLSAGTLYGDSASLNNGTNRQYNIIQLRCNNENTIFTIYSREDRNGRIYPIPSWGNGRIGVSSHSSWETIFISTRKADIETQLNFVMSEAEKKQDLNWGVNQLLNMDKQHPMIRKVLLDYLERINNHEQIIRIFKEPINNAEAILLMEAADKSNDFKNMKEILAIPFISNNIDSAVKEKRMNLSLRLKEKHHGTN